MRLPRIPTGHGRSISRAALALAIVVPSTTAFAQVGAPRLLADLSPGTSSSLPDNLVAFRDHTYFFAADPGSSSRRGLFRTDGTTAGTTLVVGGLRSPGELCAARSFLAFHASDGSHGDELWVSDGTTAGTRQFDIYRTGVNESIGSRPRNLQPLGDAVLFRADDRVNGYELWFADGVNPPTMVIDLNPGMSPSTPVLAGQVGCNVVFSAMGRLWATDGTSGGTGELVGDPDPQNGNISSLGPFVDVLPSGQALFRGSYRDPATNISENVFWITDGTSSGTSLFTSGGGRVAQNWTPSRATPIGVFWVADRQGLGSELWRFDGAGSLQLVADLDPGAGGSDPQFLAFAGDQLYFTADDGTGRAMFRTDGTPSGTIKLGLSGATFGGGVGLDTRSVVFVADADPAGTELWHCDGSSGGFTRLSDINPVGSSVISAPLVRAGLVYFTATQPITGNEPWVLDPGRVAWDDPGGCGCPPPRLRLENGILSATLHVHGNVTPGWFSGPGIAVLVLGDRAAAPIPIPGGCEIDVRPMVALAFVPNAQGGAWSQAIPVPNQPGLAGVAVMFQAVLVDGFRFAVTNAAHILLGY